MNCNHIDCKELETPAEYFPILLVRPKNYSGRPARVCIQLPLCEKHAKGKPEEFITENAWNMIIGAYAKLGKRKPHRASCGIDFDYIAAEKWKTECVFIFGTTAVN